MKQKEAEVILVGGRPELNWARRKAHCLPSEASQLARRTLCHASRALSVAES